MEIQKEKLHDKSSIKRTIAVMSGKGGVGKSSVTSLLAASLQSRGYRVGILDADITGPSIPKVFGINEKRVAATSEGVYPVETSTGIKVVSVNLMIEKEDSPVIWRGPIVANAVKQFYTDVIWGELDYLLLDLPPGTGDVPLTIMQSISLDGLVVISSPQDLVKLIVKKSINMANMMNIPIVGVVENMSYMECPHCKDRLYPFGESKVSEALEGTGISLLGQLPIDPDFTQLSDEGKIELYPRISESFSGIIDSFVSKAGER
ncbi:Chromosome partitioning ATPase, Mrp family, contains Fe-S cluster [Peptoclostridium litorale DSM 5388]|uniref:Iron-sulfur cluster carrier protein n=1 Tax=Peptoclostridium litorale DSM 5388 TaxID=1121324 RepID=A0A069RGG8_PEPLI|nr:Mrp/NBP35 family ATP-binding protein [Peptoclostridium litorale]KDR96104.1 protein Mrp [Peptoclostridium litorale DSM 5388]SIO04578.1 Chromosome partitioning ATPase, Mrp family, contains Fe-S cluster [Peptoclostridium litorale DSM 5388]